MGRVSLVARTQETGDVARRRVALSAAGFIG
jgi:hypothetical protein